MTSHLDTSVFRDPVPALEIAAQRPAGLAGLVMGSKLYLAVFAASCLTVWLIWSMGIAEATVDSFGLEISARNVGSGIFQAGAGARATDGSTALGWFCWPALRRATALVRDPQASAGGAEMDTLGVLFLSTTPSEIASAKACRSPVPEGPHKAT